VGFWSFAEGTERYNQGHALGDKIGAFFPFCQAKLKENIMNTREKWINKLRIGRLGGRGPSFLPPYFSSNF